MPMVRRIHRLPVGGINHFVVDANFLANRFIPIAFVPDKDQADRVRLCDEWWDEIDQQLENDLARVYIPDICIAETFKVLAKKYYVDKWFRSPVGMNNARKALRQTITTPPKVLRSSKRRIRYHDVPTTRDVIIAVDRFYELFLKAHLNVSLPDLLIVSTAKYLIDFYDIPKKRLHIITLDRPLRTGSKRIGELPNAYDPTLPEDSASRVWH